ncbi:hypothetical protein [Roseobacter sp.]|uniref:hypothetical protein n=1 Tax=Roseobacter sp. TaxID=1907202 RepID=UPI003299437D
MQLVFHTGAHFTEQDRLMRCLLKNKEAFGQQGIAVPGPGKYRTLLNQTVDAMTVDAPASDAREILLDAILDEETAHRVILSNSRFLGAPRFAIDRGVIYPNAGQRVARLAHLFLADDIELFMAVKNPASFMPAVYQRSPKNGLAEFTDGVDPHRIYWSDTVTRILDAAPGVKITIWCSEDAPLIWSQVLREMGGVGPADDIEGSYDLLEDIMAKEGMTRFRAFLEKHPNMTELQKRRAIVAFLEAFAIPEEIEEELDMPGWTTDTVDALTEIYDDDIAAMERMPGVRVITP